MNLEETNFIEAVHVVEVGGEAVDAIELTDGRVLAINGAFVTLFADMDALFASEDDDEEAERAVIALL